MRHTYRPLLHESLRQLLYLIMLAALIGLLVRLNFSDADSRLLDPWILLAVLVIFHLQVLICSPLYYFEALRTTADQVWYPRGSWYSQVYGLLTYLPLTLVLWVSHGRLWTFASIGFTSQMDWTWSIVVGMVYAILFAFAHDELVARLSLQPSEELSSNNAMYLRTSLPRGKLAQMMSYFDTIVFHPVYEEIIFRGFFVYYVGHLLSSPLAGAGIGLVLCVWLHLYQGGKRILPVAFFFLSTVLLLYSSFGLLAAIAFHVACNARVKRHTRQRAQEYLEFVQACRDTESVKRRERQKDHIQVNVFDPDNFQPWPPLNDS